MCPNLVNLGSPLQMGEGMPLVACLNFPSISKELWTFLVSWPTLNQTRVMTPKPMFHMATPKAT